MVRQACRSGRRSMSMSKVRRGQTSQGLGRDRLGNLCQNSSMIPELHLTGSHATVTLCNIVASIATVKAKSTGVQR